MKFSDLINDRQCWLSVIIIIMALLIVFNQPTEIVEGYQDCPKDEISFSGAGDPTSLTFSPVGEDYVLNPLSKYPSSISTPCNACPPSWAYLGSQPKPLEMMVGVSSEQCQSFWII